MNPDEKATQYILSLYPTLYLPLWKRDGTVFRSDDAYGHLCTATGAVWNRQGRIFDGVDDYITVADNSDIYVDAGTEYSYAVWVKVTNTNTSLTILGSVTAATVSASMCTQAGLLRANKYGVGYADTSSFSLPVGSFALCVMTHNTLTGELNYYGNGVNAGTSTWAQTFTGKQKSVGTTIFGGVPDQLWNGTIGDVLIFSRVLSASEIMQLYQLTKWRYQ